MLKKIKTVTSIIVVVALLVSIIHSMKVKSKSISEFLDSDDEDIIINRKDTNIDVDVD